MIRRKTFFVLLLYGDSCVLQDEGKSGLSLTQLLTLHNVFIQRFPPSLGSNVSLNV